MNFYNYRNINILRGIRFRTNTKKWLKLLDPAWEGQTIVTEDANQLRRLLFEYIAVATRDHRWVTVLNQESWDPSDGFFDLLATETSDICLLRSSWYQIPCCFQKLTGPRLGMDLLLVLN